MSRNAPGSDRASRGRAKWLSRVRRQLSRSVREQRVGDRGQLALHRPVDEPRRPPPRRLALLGRAPVPPSYHRQGGGVMGRQPPPGVAKKDMPDLGNGREGRVGVAARGARYDDGAAHGRPRVQAPVRPAAHGPGPAARFRRPRLERGARLRLPGPPAGQLRQSRPAPAPRRPRVAGSLPRGAVAVRGAAAGVPGRRRPDDGGAHAGIHGHLVPEADRRGGAARARCAAAGAAGRHLQRSPAVERGAGRVRADRVGRGWPGISRRSGTSCWTRAAWATRLCRAAISCRR